MLKCSPPLYFVIAFLSMTFASHVFVFRLMSSLKSILFISALGFIPTKLVGCSFPFPHKCHIGVGAALGWATKFIESEMEF